MVRKKILELHYNIQSIQFSHWRVDKYMEIKQQPEYNLQKNSIQLEKGVQY